MDRIIIAVAQAHEADPRNVYCDHGGADQHRPKDIIGGPLMLDPLRNANPAQKRKRHIGK